MIRPAQIINLLLKSKIFFGFCLMLGFLFAVSEPGLAQVDTLKSDFQKSFDQFQKSTQQEFSSFKTQNDSIFSKFLEDSWKEFKLLRDTRSQIPKPEDQPRMDVKPIKDKELVPGKRKTMLQDTGKQIQFQMVPNGYQTHNAVKTSTSIDFYGLKVGVYRAETIPLSTGSLSKKKIAAFFLNNAENDELLYSVYDLFNKSSEKNLNGWGYIRLLQEASSTFYQSMNERVLFTWTALIKTGYDAKVGYDQDDIYLMVNFDVPVYYKSYLVNNDKKYYLIPFKGQKKDKNSITSYQADYPGKLQTVSLIIRKNPLLPIKEKEKKLYHKNVKINIGYNENLVNFYQSYPDCELSVYYPPPLSDIALEGTDRYFRSRLLPKSEIEQINFILDFVQNTLVYKTDDKQFGYENYMFAEETLYYPSADCEDRTVLLSQLIQHYTGFKTIALAFPGHVTLAVNFPGKLDGSFVKYKGENYYVCDPTYIGSRCGMLMPEFENVNPEIITF